MTRAPFEHLLLQARRAHETRAALRDFCAFAQDVTPIDVAAHHIPAADLMYAETAINGVDPLGDAFIAAGPHACWRETYKHTDIAQDFKDRFGCYALIGGGGAFESATMAAYVVYMPAGLHYPWHHHRAEELYLVLAGQAEFLRKGQKPKVLGPGASSFHASDQPHAMRTTDQPVLAYVLWRNHFGVSPVWTEEVSS